MLRFTPKQREALLLLASPTPAPINDIAATLGVNRKTLYKWTKSPDFQAVLADEKRKLLDAALSQQRDRIAALAAKAIDHLELAATSTKPSNASVRAAQILLTMGGLLSSVRQQPAAESPPSVGVIQTEYEAITTDANDKIIALNPPQAQQA